MRKDQAMTFNKNRGGSPGRALRRILLAACALPFLAGAGFLATTPALAQQAYLQVTQAAYGGSHTVDVPVNKSMIVDLPADAKEVIVSQPNVAGTIMRSKRRAIIQGISSGSTNIFFLDETGSAIAVLDIKVQQQASPVAEALQDTLNRVLVGSNITVETLSDGAIDGTTHFLLTGTVMSGEDKAVAEALASDISEGDEPVGSLIQVVGPTQVMLKVTVAEVRRDTLKDLGINLSGSIGVGNATIGFNTTQAEQPDGGTLGFSTSNVDLNIALRALTERNAIRLLAEPTLTAISGSPAELLVGGELPIETTDSSGVATTEWKPFGVELEFTPTIKSNNKVTLAVNTSVSELRTDGALNKRSVATTVELELGCTLSIGGIFQDSVRQQIAGLPGISKIPILGALFRSRAFVRSQTELVVLVTPYVAEVGAPVALPTDGYQLSTDAEAIFLGQMEKNYGVGTDHFRGGYDGSVGFVLD
jgi:pilus assembly protein CpaC